MTVHILAEGTEQDSANVLRRWESSLRRLDSWRTTCTISSVQVPVAWKVWLIFFFVCGQNIFFLAAANGDSKLVGTVVTLHKIKKVRLLSFFRIQIKLFRFYHSVGSHFWKTGHVNNVQPSLQKGIDRREMNRPRVIHGCETTIDKEFGASNLILEGPCVLQIVQMVILTGWSLKDRASAQFDVDSAESNRRKKTAEWGYKACREGLEVLP